MGRRRRSDGPNGLVLIDKPVGMSSYDVIRDLKRLYGQPAIGHSGTLDPMASGLLVVCMGSATRFMPWLEHDAKEYVAEITLGATTSSDDKEGEVLVERSVPALSQDDIERSLEPLRGSIDQIPPQVSAIHVDGERAYARVRRGETVEVAPRRVTVHELELLGWDSPRLTVRAYVSKGTYIRSIARDLGELVGCGAHLSALRRTRVGAWTVDEATSLDAIRASVANGCAPPLQPTGAALAGLTQLRTSDEVVHRLYLGQVAVLDEGPPATLEEEQEVAVFREHDDSLVGVATLSRGGEGLRLAARRLLPQA